VAIVLLHGFRFTDHEARVAAIAREIGFTQVSVSHEVSPLMKLVGRGDTTVVDAYLSPILRRYVDRWRGAGPRDAAAVHAVERRPDRRPRLPGQGRHPVRSGRRRGRHGRTAGEAGFERVIGFDMGGTSTDVCHFAGEYERAYETVVAGVRMRAPMMNIHTVAAGGGSICAFDGARFRVGPASAGANPGTGLLSAGRAADGDRLQRHAGQAVAGLLPGGVRPERRPAAGRDAVARFEAMAARSWRPPARP
jgi:5-oxoprolinase (ATP-hydrolysing)